MCCLPFLKNMARITEKQYQEHLKRIEDFNAKHAQSICQFKKGSCRSPYQKSCCGGCDNLGPNGCTTRNIFCKLFYCDAAKEEFMTPEQRREYDKINKEFYDIFNPVVKRPDGTSTRRYQIRDYYATEEAVKSRLIK
jgi:hypothetical protein